MLFLLNLNTGMVIVWLAILPGLEKSTLTDVS